MKKILHKIKENKMMLHAGLLLLVALLLSIPMLHPQTDIYLDDGSQHLMRAYHSYQSILKNGTETVILDFASGFGYSWNLFYGPLSSDFIMLLGVIFGSFNLGFKIAIFLILFFAGILMYKLVHEMTENKNTALLAGIIYMTSPYFFTDLYVRHSMGECMAFVFIPLVFLGLYNLFNTEKNHYYLILGAARIDYITQYFYGFNSDICGNLLYGQYSKHMDNPCQKRTAN